MLIKNLPNNEAEISIVARWLWQEWGQPSNFNYWYSWVASSMFTDKIPQTFVYLDSSVIIGTVSLWRCDLQSRQDISPWLGGLYVHPSYRNRGVGRDLEEYACKIAHILGYEDLYMFTELDKYFEKLNWVYLCDIPDETGNMVKLYKKDL